MDRDGLEMQVPGRRPWTSEFGRVDGIDLDAYHSLERGGGDLFDAVRVGPRVAFLLSDIAGRKPELDPVSAEMQRVFRAKSTEHFSAANVNLMETTERLVLEINEALIGAAKGVRFAPTMVGCYDERPGILAYVNAGGQTAVFQDSEGTRALPNVSIPLGLFTHMTYDASIQAFEVGATLLVVTKGVTECMGSKRPFGQEGVIDEVRSGRHGSASALCRGVVEAAHRFEKRRWGWLPFRGVRLCGDMTALAMVRTV